MQQLNERNNSREGSYKPRQPHEFLNLNYLFVMDLLSVCG